MATEQAAAFGSPDSEPCPLRDTYNPAVYFTIWWENVFEVYDGKTKIVFPKKKKMKWKNNVFIKGLVITIK